MLQASCFLQPLDLLPCLFKCFRFSDKYWNKYLLFVFAVYLIILTCNKLCPSTDYEGPRRWMTWVVSATPRLLYPRERDSVPILQMLCGTQGWCERLQKISPPPGYDLRIVHPVASRYTLYAIPAHDLHMQFRKCFLQFFGIHLLIYQVYITGHSNFCRDYIEMFYI
jgi:hypothetical protein